VHPSCYEEVLLVEQFSANGNLWVNWLSQLRGPPQGKDPVTIRSGMRCVERDRLWEAYNVALNQFTECAEDLAKLASATAFGSKLIALQASKEQCKQAREAWEIHLREHQCDRQLDRQSSAAER
jgi:hypothetical protein